MFLCSLLQKIHLYFDFPFHRFKGTTVDFKIKDRKERDLWILKINMEKQIIEEYIPHMNDTIDLICEKDLGYYLSGIEETSKFIITNNNYFDNTNIKSIIETYTDIYSLSHSIEVGNIVNGKETYKV